MSHGSLFMEIRVCFMVPTHSPTSDGEMVPSFPFTVSGMIKGLI